MQPQTRLSWLPQCDQKTVAYAVCAAGVLWYAIVFFKNAWVGDDAYILFRSLDQLLDGNGPRWNPHERVQVFTCPLWYGLLATLGLFSRDHYWHAIVLSAICNAVVLWRLWQVLPTPTNRLCAVVLLTFSQAYFDFTSSGLENPLAYALLASVVRYHWLEDLPTATRHTRLLVSAGLLLVTRHDLLLPVLPVLLHSLAHHRPRTISLLLLLAPLTAWTAFAVTYYGFPFPNTAYAKLAGVVPRATFIQHGVLYFQTSFLRDMPSLAILACGIITGLVQDKPSRRVAVGVLLHLAYTVWIGGDFMRGRFFSWDVLLCTLLLLKTPLPLAPWRWLVNGRTAPAMLAIALGLLLPWQPPLLTPPVWGTPPFAAPDTADGITQERNFYFRFTSFTRYLRKQNELLHAHGWCADSVAQQQSGSRVTLANTMGFRGYCLGTQGIVLDWLGITDPLLARMPKDPRQQHWRPGHTQRLLPEGYCSSVLHGDNRITDATLHSLYDDLLLLTQAPDLFSAARWHAIWRFNTGGYADAWQAVATTMQAHASAPDGMAWQQAARQDCPVVILSPAEIERLKTVNPDTD